MANCVLGMVYFKILSKHLHGRTKENLKNPQLGQQASVLLFS